MLRSRLLTWISACVAGPLVAGAAQAQLVVGEETVPAFDRLLSGKERIFEPLPPAPADTGTLLINGTPVDPAFFPGIFRMTTGGTCTASLVGPATILLAAHCVDHGALVQFAVGPSLVRSICEQADGFRLGNASTDWALCLLEHAITGLAYETINASSVPAIGERIFLTGYGCTQQGGGLDGVLRIGFSTVDERPAGFPPETSTIYTTSDISAGEAVLCPGDSGGPAFIIAGDEQGSSRKIVGVNSRTTFQFGVSLLAATGSSAGRLFIEDWASRHEHNGSPQEICGVTLSVGCR